MTTKTTPVRQRRALESAVYLSGSGEVVDFLLPLFAGATMGLSPSQIGILMAVELVVSLLVRPMAGSLADRWERRNIAAVGALLYAVSCVGYAVAPNASVVYAAAAIGGIGGALVWVSLRSMVGEGLEENSGVFAKLVASEESGGWLIFAPALFLISLVGYRGVFAALAVCCLIGAAILWAAPRKPRRPSPPRDSATADRARFRSRLLPRLSPMLAAVALTMTAEAAISLLMILHLQNEFGLDPLEVGVVFLPGAIVMSILPSYLHGIDSRYGRTKVLALASVASAGFAVSLSVAPNTLIIGVCWILAAASWAVVLPIQQSVIAEASGQHHLGRGLGWYESATLTGALIGSLAAGYLYELGTWRLACLVAAVVILAGAVVVPAAVRALKVAQFPTEPEPLEEEDEDEEEEDEPQEDQDEVDDAEDSEDEEEEPEPTRAELANSFAWHTVFLIAALAIAHLFIDGAQLTNIFQLPSVPPEPFTPETTINWSAGADVWGQQLGDWAQELGDWAGVIGGWIGDHFRGIAAVAGLLQIWLVVWVMDFLSTIWKLPQAPKEHAEQSQ